MTMLSVHCVKCRKLIPTGLDVSYETLADMTFSDRTTECPHCETLQTWNLKDVDLTPFKKIG